MNSAGALKALEWVILNSAISDVELAGLSNVCESWRDVVIKCLASGSATKEEATTKNQNPAAGGLLMSLTRRLLDMSGSAPTRNSGETFCLAWFAPEGIRRTRVSLDPDIDDHNKNNNKKTRKQPEMVLVTEEWRGFQNPDQILHHFGYTQSFLQQLWLALPSSPQRDKLLNVVYSKHETTLAVRGATVARPESYCLCVDKESNQTLSNGRKKKELQHSVLPRIVTSDAAGNGVPSVFVQFLNCTGDHAVCMMTPPFECGPIPEPITLFCVGIATEDGCFVSGLHHRFELGHLYPANEFLELTELSPICIAAEGWEAEPAGVDEKLTTAQPPSTRRSSWSDDSSSNESDGDMSSGISCECMFQGRGEKLAEMDRDPERIHRGQLGPGSWHCYVAIFDGSHSRIRVDGVEEPINSEDCGGGGGRRLPFPRGMLDGLTIGSDHCFDLSLCCGVDSDGGKGAIAEVAAFAGHMNQTDIETLESHLMEKHSIRTPAHDFRKLNEMERRAHALFCNGFMHNDNGSSSRNNADGSQNRLPLGVVARHRAVAWKLVDPVTGGPKSVQRIGAKIGGESSDW